METALINMFMGMGVVFSVLILISLIITCFKFLPYLEQKFEKKVKVQNQKEVNGNKLEIIDTHTQPNYELVAVIMAAIANEENCSVHDFVVKSIKRR